ncbi:MAG TPA: hypothetical protein VGQ54_04055 [Burkholderiales bacterium]|jgi:hypothetical protein|nr:hypothetical protein [Burkholderiales bacterium]
MASSLALGRLARRQKLVLGEITQLGFSLLKARSANPSVGPDLAEFTDRPMAAGTAESLFYLADHIFPGSQSSVIELPAGAAWTCL